MGDPRHLAYAIMKFLEDQVVNGGHSEDKIESLEVARQCLESAYELESAVYPMPRPLLEIFSQAVPRIQEEPKVIPEEDISPLTHEQAEKYKNEGNECMKQENYEQAVECYTKAVELDTKNAIYHCNRAAAYSKLNQHEKALDDCSTALTIDPQYSKAHGRKGLAHAALNQFSLARDCYEEALRLDPTNESYKNNLELTKEKLKEEPNSAGAGGAGFPGMGGMGGMGGMDFGSFLNNPALMNMATSMLSQPGMQQMMANLMSGASQEPGGQQGIGNLLQAGQAMAQHMQQQNPELVEHFRAQMRTGQDGNPTPETGAPGNPPDADPGSKGDDAR